MNSVGTRHLLAALLTAGTAAIATPSMAQEPGNWLVRGRVIHVTPNDRSGEVTTLAGSGVGVATTPPPNSTSPTCCARTGGWS